MAQELEGTFELDASVADGRRAGPRTEPIPTLVVEAHPALRAAFEAVLARADSVELVGAVATLAAANAALAKTTKTAKTAKTAGSARWTAPSVEVVVASEHLPDGSGTNLCAAAAAVVIVSSDPSDAAIAAAFRAGARGLVATASPVGTVRAAVEAVGDGGTYVDPAVAARLVAQLGWPDPGPLGLTGQELRVVRLLPRGLTNRQIAAELGLSPETVKSHLRRALPKLGAADRVEAAEVVLREGLA